MIARFIVRPKPSGTGFILTGPTLPYPQSYPNEVHAGDYAHWSGRETGGTVIYLTRRGDCIITETIERHGGLSTGPDRQAIER